ncbi:MAG: tRNA pseudouridine(55) synthase TruB [Candidatus Endonucleobacter bathymodioli]|uniref:tRNA pseudouridine synthase B n=1 Tax=Candidatus Endonucleibacter bathymodioli TaxID=539814 RepID=A0AA90NPK6_9GAMM|nr:tRNA pseudouridine(55) synthase TruB [Candidatus Endonucleobacter bathymodioli]
MLRRNRNRSHGRQIDGIVIVDKFKGASSNDVLQRVKRIFGAEKAGHTGSLDPLATGVLPICLGEATKFCQFLLESNKSYRTLVQLGVKTTTGDGEGEVVEEREVKVKHSDIEAVLKHFTGDIDQVPSMYSALKHKGQPLYKLARKGIEVHRPARTISIFRNELINFNGDQFMLEVDCSKGTYIRTLAEDIGDALGCLAHVAELRRLKAGPYSEKDSYSIEDLVDIKTQGRSDALTKEQTATFTDLTDRTDNKEYGALGADDLRLLKELTAISRKGGNAALDKLLLSLDTSVNDWPQVSLGVSSSFYISQGQPVMVPHAPHSGYVRLYGAAKEGEDRYFLGVGEILDDGRVAPKRLIRTPA